MPSKTWESAVVVAFRRSIVDGHMEITVELENCDTACPTKGLQLRVCCGLQDATVNQASQLSLLIARRLTATALAGPLPNAVQD